MTLAYQRYHSLKTRIVRIFNTYGPRMRLHDGRAIPEFILQCLEKKDITVFGDGSQTRSFCYVSDLVDGLVRLAFSGHPGPVNLGNPREMTVHEFAVLIKELTRCESGIVFHPLPEDDPKRRQPDIALARQALGWEPKVSLEAGLKATVEYFMGQIQESPRVR